MTLSEWMREASQDARQQVAEKAGTSVAYLWQLAGFHRTPSAALAAKIEAATKGKVTRLELLYKDCAPSKPKATHTNRLYPLPRIASVPAPARSNEAALPVS